MTRIPRVTRTLASLAVVAMGWMACSGPSELVQGQPGDPLAGLGAADATRFERGRSLFDQEFTPESGLGPLFNQRRCSSCHDVPVIGGGGVERVVKATVFEPPDRCNVLSEFGGPLFPQQVTEEASVAGIELPVVPEHANARARLNAPPLFAGGLIESIPDEVLLALADPDDDDGNGISGRAARDGGRVGRFGLKASHATLEGFVIEALAGEMGLSTAPGSEDAAPEMSAAQVESLVAFSALLGPVGAESESGRGEDLFASVGCASCHTPFHEAGTSAPAGMAGRSFPLYSDLLLHDLGPEVSGHCAPEASPTEWRTQPLAGLRYRAALMHDGRSNSVEDAVARHGGEAALVVARFGSLSATDRDALLRFVNGL